MNLVMADGKSLPFVRFLELTDLEGNSIWVPILNIYIEDGKTGI